MYQLRFAAGSRQAGTWDPNYFDFFRTPKQLRSKTTDTPRANGWGGALVGVHKPADPRKYFLPLAGLAVPVTAAVDFTKSGSKADSVRDATFSSIIGDRGRVDTPNSSDGVVPYWSSHLAGAQPELIVPGPHGSFALPQTIAELKRILRLHLATLSRSGSSDTSKKSPSAPGRMTRRSSTVWQVFASYCSSLRE